MSDKTHSTKRPEADPVYVNEQFRRATGSWPTEQTETDPNLHAAFRCPCTEKKINEDG